MKNLKKINYLFIILLLSIIFLFSFSTFSFAAYPKLVSKIISAFEKVEKYIIAIATPATAVSLGCGFLMQKFSFGDEEKIRTGKKLIRTSVISYAFVISIDLLVSMVEQIIS